MTAVLNRREVGGVQVYPGNVALQTTDSYATITAAGYLSPNIAAGFVLAPTDIISACYGTNSATVSFFGVSFDANNIPTLAPSISGDVVLPTIANHIATYANITGGLTEDAATAINGGNIQAGLDSTAGFLASFPATTATGSLRVKAVSNSGAFITTISNAAMGQTSVVSIPDVGAATGQFLVKTAALVSGNFPKNSGTAGLMIDSGFSVPAADASANADATTIAVPISSNGAATLSFANTLGRYAAGSFTLAQVLAAYNTPLEIIPAPGSNLMILIDYFALELIYGSAAYVSGGAAYLQYGATAHGTNYATPVGGIPAAVFTGLAASLAISAAGQINATTGLATSVAGNAAITYTNATGVFTGGTGGSARWYCYYSIVPIT